MSLFYPQTSASKSVPDLRFVFTTVGGARSQTMTLSTSCCFKFVAKTKRLYYVTASTRCQDRYLLIRRDILFKSSIFLRVMSEKYDWKHLKLHLKTSIEASQEQ